MSIFLIENSSNSLTVQEQYFKIQGYKLLFGIGYVNVNIEKNHLSLQQFHFSTTKVTMYKSVIIKKANSQMRKFGKQLNKSVNQQFGIIVITVKCSLLNYL